MKKPSDLMTLITPHNSRCCETEYEQIVMEYVKALVLHGDQWMELSVDEVVRILGDESYIARIRRLNQRRGMLRFRTTQQMCCNMDEALMVKAEALKGS